MACTFSRGLDPDTLEKVIEFFNTGVGRQIKKAITTAKGSRLLHICIRDNYINIYWNGCSLLKYAPQARTNIFLIHHKYCKLTKDELKNDSPYISLLLNNDSSDLKTELSNGWSFINDIVNKVGLIGLDDYGSKGEKKELANYLNQTEDTFLDLEIAFSQVKNKQVGTANVANRIDLARLVKNSHDSALLQLVEVKLLSDSRLRSRSEPEIKTQMKNYIKFINNCKSEITNSYKKVAENYREMGFIGFNDAQAELIKQFIKAPQVDDNPCLLILTDKELNEKDRYHLDRLAKYEIYIKIKDSIPTKYQPVH